MKSWRWQVFSLELRRLFTYRLDFWVQFFLPIFGTLGISYFLWGAIFRSQNLSEIGGFSFYGIMFYYLIVSLVDHMVLGPGWELGLSEEIYQGTINRYLVYPVSVFQYKYQVSTANSCVALFQFFLSTGIYLAIFSSPPEIHLSVLGTSLCVLSCVVACFLFFLMTSILDLVAFWADNVWSLQVLLRFLVSLCGGILFPLSFFPEKIRFWIYLTPFPSLIWWPTRTFLGQMALGEWMRFFEVSLLWCVLLSAALSLEWRRGLRQYSGVGL